MKAQRMERLHRKTRHHQPQCERNHRRSRSARLGPDRVLELHRNARYRHQGQRIQVPAALDATPLFLCFRPHDHPDFQAKEFESLPG